MGSLGIRAPVSSHQELTCAFGVRHCSVMIGDGGMTLATITKYASADEAKMQLKWRRAASEILRNMVGPQKCSLLSLLSESSHLISRLRDVATQN